MSGLQLHPEVQSYLDELAGLHLPPSAGVPVADLRDRFRRICAHFAGPRIELPCVEPIDAPVPARLYQPSPSSPILLWFHGGRLISGDLDTHDAACRLLAAVTRHRVVAFNYRLAPEHPFPAALDDAREAVRWASGRFGPVAAGGDSAGAVLALDAALHCPAALRALVLVYPMIDATLSLPSHTEFRLGPGTSSLDVKLGYDLWLPNAARTDDPRVSPLFAPGLDVLPPTWIATAEYDPLRDEGLQFARRLAAAGVRVGEHFSAGHIHGYLTYPGRFSEARVAARKIAGFLDSV
jgi:acetyl esterase